MSALHRHCTENKEELTKMIPQEPVSFFFIFLFFFFLFKNLSKKKIFLFFKKKLEELFRVLGVLDKKQLEYERKALEHLKNNPIMHRPSISLTEIRK